MLGLLRYSRLADWDYIERCAANCLQMPVIGNGDVVSFEDWNTRMQSGQLATGMIARGALIKPWIFTEVRSLLSYSLRSADAVLQGCPAKCLQFHDVRGLWGTPHAAGPK